MSHHTTAVHTRIVWPLRSVNHTNTGVLRILLWEIPYKRHTVTAIAIAFFQNLRRTCLTCNSHQITLRFACTPRIDRRRTQSIIPHHLMQTFAYPLERSIAAHTALHHTTLKRLNQLTILTYLFDHQRSNHLSVVSNAVVEHQHLQRT